MTQRPINLAQLSPVRRGFLIGYRRARARARTEMYALAADYDAELADLERRLREIAVEYHRTRVDAPLLMRPELNARQIRACCYIESCSRERVRVAMKFQTAMRWLYPGSGVAQV